jgi:nitroreductase
VEGRRQGRDLLFYDAPAVLLFHHSPYVDASEAMIACTYAMLAAESLGLGTTMIGAAAPIIMRKRELCQQLGIPDGNKPAIALILGYPAVHFRRGVIRRFASVSRFG